MREAIDRLLRAYSRILNKHKYVTQIVTGGVLWFSGDILCQGLSHLAGQEMTTKTASVDRAAGSRPERGTRWSIDWQRVQRMTLYGVCCSAPAYAFWYSALERVAQRVYAAQPPGSPPRVPAWLRTFSTYAMAKPLQTFLLAPDGAARLRTWKIIGFKLAMDTFVFDPAYLALFFTATSLMEGRSLAEVGRRLRTDLAPTWLVDIAVWTPIQTANFRFVPVLYQALVVQSCNIGWNAYLSFVQHRPQSS